MVIKSDVEISANCMDFWMHLGFIGVRVFIATNIKNKNDYVHKRIRNILGII